MTATRPPIAYQRLLVTIAASAMVGALLSLPSEFPTRVVVSRTIVAGLLVMMAFSFSERWPAQLPRLLSRWAWQLLAVLLSTPPAAAFAYWLMTGGDPQWTHSPDSKDRIESTLVLAFVGGARARAGFGSRTGQQRAGSARSGCALAPFASADNAAFSVQYARHDSGLGKQRPGGDQCARQGALARLAFQASVAQLFLASEHTVNR